MLTIDGISRTSKPIVVLTGNALATRTDLFDIVEYGVAVGLKMIVEARPGNLTENILQEYKRFGPRVFRIILDGDIIEDPDTRYRQSARFCALESCISRMRASGFEIHLSISTGTLDARQLAFYHDYAFRKAAEGLYFHLSAGDPNGGSPTVVESDREEILRAIATMKTWSPAAMYNSPQCIKYVFEPEASVESPNGRAGRNASSGVWQPWCQGGKTFAFISGEGEVQVCPGLSKVPAGQLRSCGYDFRRIWQSAGVFQCLRENLRSCRQTREALDSLALPHVNS